MLVCLILDQQLEQQNDKNVTSAICRNTISLCSLEIHQREAESGISIEHQSFIALNEHSFRCYNSDNYCPKYKTRVSYYRYAI